MMIWASASSRLGDSRAAADEVARTLRATLGDGSIDLLMAFFDASHVRYGAVVAEALKGALDPGCLIGASANGVVSATSEIESGPALSVVAARLPGVELKPFVMDGELWAHAAEGADEFARAAPGAAGAELAIVLGDPFSLPIGAALAGFNRFASGVRVVGGMASAGARRGSNALVLNDWIAAEGGVGLALSGALRADVVVSQGCHPIGPPLEITHAEGNLIVELDGQPALERAEQVLVGLSARERESLRNGLYIGRPMRAGAGGRGDYLIRNLLGADRNRGVLAIDDRAARRERIRLHVRDAASAREDLELLLAPQEFDSRAQAALVFPCNGRGRAFYGEPDRDITTLQQALGGGVPAAGMFCAGEIGPVGDKNFLHGHTASIAILRPR